MSDSTTYVALEALEDATPIIVAAFSGAQAGKVVEAGSNLYALVGFVVSTLFLVWFAMILIRCIIRWADRPTSE